MVGTLRDEIEDIEIEDRVDAHLACADFIMDDAKNAKGATRPESFIAGFLAGRKC